MENRGRRDAKPTVPKRRGQRRPARLALLLLLLPPAPAALASPGSAPRSGEEWAARVTIHRDEWGVPHVRGESDAAVAFGSAWAQCEDHFFQLEDSYLQALGRYSELVGERGLENDLEVAAFELTASAQRDFPNLPAPIRHLAEGFAAGYNFYAARHPTEPRLLHRMEPYHVLAFERFMMLGRLLGASHVDRRGLVALATGSPPREGGAARAAAAAARQRMGDELRSSLGSNQWAVGPSRTRDRTTMLFINPHQPWYGPGMFTEMHVRSDQDGPASWNFSGAMYPGSPFPTAGFNSALGWAYTVNEADIADVYRLTFDDPQDPLRYRYGAGYRRAEEWSVELAVKTAAGVLSRRTFTLRKSHHGPLLAREDAVHLLAVRVPKLHDGSRMVQSLAQTKARNFAEWYRAAAMLQLQTFNTMYADRDGNIFYLYNGTVPKRRQHAADGRPIDWTRPVDGGDPDNEWQGFFAIEQLPQVLNPPSGYVQNCNSTPFTTTDDGNPSRLDFPPYMVEDQHDDKRRAKLSRYLLRRTRDLTFEDWQALVYDTTLYWPLTELPVFARHWERVQQTDPVLAERVRPYLEHLLAWDHRGSLTSTQATLAVEWYQRLYGRGYPVETLLAPYVSDVPARFAALIDAAERLRAAYGDWRVPYGRVHRIQRQPGQSTAAAVPFRDEEPSLPLAGVPGPLGVAFTVYYAPNLDREEAARLGLPPRGLRYATTGASYQAVVEFGARTRAATTLHYGQSQREESPHYFDQARLVSERRFKPAWIEWSDVLAHTVAAYHPGESPAAPAAAAP